jgi:hypothetical protein
VTGLSNTAVLFDNQNQPRPALPYVGLTRRDFPFSVFDDELITEVTTAITLTITAAAAGETASLILFGTRYAYTLTGADDAEVARDALLAAITEDLCRLVTSADGTNFAVGFQPSTCTATGLDALTFAGLGAGPVRVSVVEGCTLGAPTLAYRSIQSGLRRAIIRLDLYWPERQDGFETIDEYAEVLRSSLQREETAWWLTSRGVGVEQQGTISIQEASAVSGGARQRRKFFDVIFNAQSQVYRAANSLDSVVPPSVEIIAP